MNLKNKIGVVVLVLTIFGVGILVADAAISSILMGGKVTVTELSGEVEYSSNPFTEWQSSLTIQTGAIWNARICDLTMDYTGNVNVTWSLYDAGADEIIGTGDDSVIPGATFMQPITVSAGVSQNVTASTDGYNPYNWGQWTSSPMIVYVQSEVTEG